jgi:hypothetical protein
MRSICGSYPSFTHVGKSGRILFLFTAMAVYDVFPFSSVSYVSVKTLSILNIILKFPGNKLKIHLLGTDNDPGRSGPDRMPWISIQIRIRQNDADPDPQHCRIEKKISLFI